MNAVEIQNITKTFGQHTAVDDLSLGVPQGSIYGFIGPNGSGKTTTLRMIMNIIRPDRGDIRVLGETTSESVSDRIGYLPEERGLYRKMKVRDLLRFYGELKAGRKVDAQIDFWLDRFDLTSWASKKAEALSKGMSQKVQFIATVVSQPEVLILDEPFSGLDPVNADLMRESVLNLQSQGTTVLLSTHDMNVAETLCDFIFMIFEGQKVLDGTLTDIQDEFGRDAIRVRAEATAEMLGKLAGVEAVRDLGQVRELRLVQGFDPQEVLAQLLGKTRVHRFEVAKPSLHDIFVEIARPEAKEAKHA